ncbi:hypothetical protein GCM10009550_66390 [Actinocorallia libanotica]|uniref:Uncharacterized protein n=2 Tax=Actinocorallia libanotica TaxID=46162 RepID=A0ABP4CCB2_9ACTN
MCLTRNASGDLAAYEICGGHREERQLLRPLWRFPLDRYQFSLGDTQDVLAPLSLSGPFSLLTYVNEESERTHWTVYAAT